MKNSQKKIEVFNGKFSKYGGHSQWLSRLTHLDYLIIDFVFGKLHYDHYWYDGQHHTLSFGLFRIHWGGYPFKDLE